MAISEWKLNYFDRLNAYFLAKNKFYCKLSKSLDYAKPFCLPYFLLKYKFREKVVEKPFSTNKMYNFFYVKNSMLAYYFVYLNTSPQRLLIQPCSCCKGGLMLKKDFIATDYTTPFLCYYSFGRLYIRLAEPTHYIREGRCFFRLKKSYS